MTPSITVAVTRATGGSGRDPAAAAAAAARGRAVIARDAMTDSLEGVLCRGYF